MARVILPRTSVEKVETAQNDWFVVDVDGMIVGRIATQIATVLMGKHKACYTPHVDCGDYVIVLNADKIRFSGKALSHDSHPYFSQKFHKVNYQHYSGYPSGQKIRTAAQLVQENPTKILSEAVRRMLPKNKLGRQMLKKLKLYAGAEHPHQSQQPKELPDYLKP